MTSEAKVMAVLADAELLRHELSYSEDLLRLERRRGDEFARRIQALEAQAGTANERQRELHVLLLHRDEEIIRLHEQLERATQLHPASDPVVVARDTDERHVVVPISAEGRLGERLAEGLIEAGRLWGRLSARRQPRPRAEHPR